MPRPCNNVIWNGTSTGPLLHLSVPHPEKSVWLTTWVSADRNCPEGQEDVVELTTPEGSRELWESLKAEWVINCVFRCITLQLTEWTRRGMRGEWGAQLKVCWRTVDHLVSLSLFSQPTFLKAASKSCSRPPHNGPRGMVPAATKANSEGPGGWSWSQTSPRPHSSLATRCSLICTGLLLTTFQRPRFRLIILQILQWENAVF